MDKIIAAIADTNVPTIVIVSGIALVFLALAGRFGTYIEIRAERQNLAAVFGTVLLLVGIGLYAYPTIVETTAQGAAGDVTFGPTEPASSPSVGSGGSSADTIRFILAGSYSIESSAEAQKQLLRDRNIDAVVGSSDAYSFLCPGYFAVMVLAPNLEATRDLLVKVREVVPDAYPRNPATFDISTC